MTELKEPIQLAGAKAARGVAGGFSGDVHSIDDPDLIWELLADPKNHLSLSHYDRLMFDLKQPIALLLGEDQCQSSAWQIFASALALEKRPLDQKNDAIGFNEPLSRNNTELIRHLAKTHCANVIENLKSSSGRKTNIIREYGYLIPFLVGLEFTGLGDSVKISKGLRAFTFCRNLRHRSLGRGRMKLSRQHGAANSYLLWTHFLLGQAFSNLGNRTTQIEKIKHRLAGWGARKYFDQIKSSFNLSDDSGSTTFNLSQRLKRFEVNLEQQPRNNLPANKEQREYLYECILFEIMMSFHILIGISFAKILDAIIEQEEDIYDFVNRLKTSSDPDRILNAYMSRDTPTAELYRIARRALPEHRIKMGDIIKFNIKDASKKLPADSDRFLNFGPHETCPYDLSANGEKIYPDGKSKDKVRHPCFGQYWARTVLKEMFFQLTDENIGFKNLSLPKTKTKGFAQIPDHLMVSFARET